MSREVTCALCGRPVDNSQVLEMPNGTVCIDPCYMWLERMMEEGEGFDSGDNEGVTIIYIEADD